MQTAGIKAAIPFALTVILFLTNQAVAQNVRTIQTWSQLALTEEGRAVAEMINGTQPMNQAVFDRFFNDVLFPLFTRSEPIKVGGKTPGGITSLAKMRLAFKATYLDKATNPLVKKHLNEITLKKMDEIASGTFHPSCRAVAMTIIADLNEAAAAPSRLRENN